MRTLTYTTAAQIDLIAIDAFLIERAGHATAADQLDRIRKTADRLPEFPRLGVLADAAEYRRMRVRGTPFVLIYRISSEQVQILRIFHGAQDWQGQVE